MKRWARRMADFLASEDGPTAAEYAIMLALVVVVSIAAIQLLGSNTENTFDELSDEVWDD